MSLPVWLSGQNPVLITTHKRGLGQGNIFTGMCQSFCSQGRGLCVMSLPVWLSSPMFLPGCLSR